MYLGLQSDTKMDAHANCRLSCFDKCSNLSVTEGRRDGVWTTLQARDTALLQQCHESSSLVTRDKRELFCAFFVIAHNSLVAFKRSYHYRWSMDTLLFFVVWY